jgi:hypothetical protein
MAVQTLHMDRDVRINPSGTNIALERGANGLTAPGEIGSASANNSIFILSISEVNEYFGPANVQTGARPTATGHYIEVVPGTINNNARQPWFMRSPGVNATGDSITFVTMPGASGGVGQANSNFFGASARGFRPAIWVNVAELECPCEFETVTVPATCLVDGSITTTCTICGEYEVEVIAARGEHDFDRGLITIYPTARSVGERLFTCKDCDYYYTVKLPELTITGLSVDAFVEKLQGNTNNLTITVTEQAGREGSEWQKEVVFTATFSIRNNAAGTYEVGPYRVFVDTKGNTQIREIFIVE